VTEHDARLVPSAILSLVTCIAITSHAAPWRAVVGALVFAAVLASSWSALRAPALRASEARIQSAVVCIFFACAAAAIVGAGAGLRADAREPEALREALESSRIVEVRGSVTRAPTPAEADRFGGDPRWFVYLEASIIGADAVRVPLIAVVEEEPRLETGQAIAVEGRISQSHFARASGTLWNARIVEVQSAASGTGAGPTSAIASARTTFLDLVEPYPDRVEGLTAGMVVGDDSAMPEAQQEEMRHSGLAHVTAVSGAHFAVLSLVVIWLVRRARLPRAAQGLAVTTAAGAFTVLVGPEPSVVRAAGMAVVMAAALVLGRRARALAALAASVLVLLAWDPWIASSLGFCLSVVAVASIAVWSPHLAARLERWVVPRAARLVAIPVAAAVVTAPLLVPLQAGIGTYVVPANILASPFVAVVTLVGLVGLVAASLAPNLGEALVSVAAALVQPVDATARAFAHAPGAFLPWPPTASGAFALACIAAALIAATVARRVRGFGLAAVVVACAVAVTGPTVLAVARAPRLPEWDVVACDVGQGDMLLLRSGLHAAVVIDVGREMGASVECLERHGVREVDLLILTHPDADHDGDTSSLLAAVPVRHAWISPVAQAAHSTALIQRRGIPVESAVTGMSYTVGAVELLVLAPSGAVEGASDNDASVVILADAGGTKVLALGDLERPGQERLVPSLPAELVVDVVKIAHHGSPNQADELAARIRARVGIVSVGAGNPYGHPAPRTLDLYDPRVSVLVRTDLCGDILVATGPQFSIASRCPSDVAG
jgi:competence protein ComEC